MSKDPSGKPRPIDSDVMEAVMAALDRAGATAAEKARQREDLENRYQPLSREQREAVLDDLKEHLKLTELLNRPTKGMKIQ